MRRRFTAASAAVSVTADFIDESMMMSAIFVCCYLDFWSNLKQVRNHSTCVCA